MTCPLPFIHLNIKPNKTTTSCWRCLENHGDYTTSSLVDLWNNKEWQDFRQQHINNERPVGCKSCWEMEDAGIESTRQVALREYPDTVYNLTPDAPQEIEMRFGNLCNLQCRHCSPKYSSQWMKQIKLHKSLKDEMKKFDSSSTEYSINELPENTFDNLTIIAPSLRLIKITGGEPLMHPMHKKMLKGLEGYEENITLEYNTNLHVLDDEIINSWEKFKKVICRVSIDADKETFSYIRTNGDIDKLIRNWQYIEKTCNKNIQSGQLDLHATCTINVLNVVRIDRVFDFFESLGSKLHVSFVQYPRMMDICNLPEVQKTQIIQTCNHIILHMKNTKHAKQNIYSLNRIIKWLEKPNNTDFKHFVQWMKIQDHINNTCLFDYYTEFDYLKEQYYA